MVRRITLAPLKRGIKIRNRAVLAAIFAIKGNWATGRTPGRRLSDGLEIAPFPNGAKAAASISADLELSWAFRQHAEAAALEKGRQTRENMPYLLRLFEDRTFPITWATVGHLFLENCERASNGLAHPLMPRPSRNELWQGDWYRHDPCTNSKVDPCWYAPDIVQAILDSPVAHEIGTHSFSHIDFSPSCSDLSLVRREIEESAAAMRPWGLEPRSLVYPFNKMGHQYLDLLAELSITAVRHRDRRVALSYPERTASGVYKLYESMNLRTPAHYDYLDKVQLFVRKAVARRAAFHLWFHPSDPAQVLESELGRIVAFLDDRRREGIVWIATMGQIAAYCEARERLRPAVERRPGELHITWRGRFEHETYGHSELSLIGADLPTPREVILTDRQGSRALEPARACVRTPDRQLSINMPTSATSLRLRF